MNTTQRPRPNLAPTSPHRPGRRQKSTSPLAPLPVGGEVELAATGDHPHNHHPPRPRGDVTNLHSASIPKDGRP